MKSLVADCRHALRVYARTPAASLLALAALAVAMAFVGALASLYSDLALKPHPGFEDGSRLVTIVQTNGTESGSLSPALIERMSGEVASLSGAAGYLTLSQRVGPEGAQRIVELVSRGFFETLAPRLALGRGFDEQDHDPGAEPVAVISDRYWRERFDGSRDVIGALVEITGRPQSPPTSPEDEPPVPPEDATTRFRIVGVMSESLPSLQAEQTAVWLPFERVVGLYLFPYEFVRDSQFLRGLGRLADGAGTAALVAEINQRYPEDETANINPGYRLEAAAGVVTDINAQRDARRQLELLLAGGVLLALVAASNVSLFLLSRAPGRRRELGIRMAVGASLRRLKRQLVSEAGLLVLGATALGLVLSLWLGGYLQSLAFLSSARFRDVTLLDWRVLGFIVAFALLIAALVSLAPVLPRVAVRRISTSTCRYC